MRPDLIAFATNVHSANTATHAMGIKVLAGQKRIPTLVSTRKNRPMHQSTDAETLADMEGATACDVSARCDIPASIPGYGPAGIDATYEDPALPADDAELCAWHVLPANDFGDARTTDTMSSARPTSHELHQDTCGRRSFTLGELVVAMIQSAAATVHRAYGRYRERRRAIATYDALRRLDDHMLRDLGFDRSELRSVAAELTGEAEQTRARTLATLHDPY
jgi:uncharacterized protein YjiS (DUF1127 family)